MKKQHQISQYDKIFKENIESIIPNLVENMLNITAIHFEEIPDDIQHTKERKPDVLKKVTDSVGSTFVLHIEFQVADETEMVYRMAEYKIMLLRIYRMPVRQFVIFLGKSDPKMQNVLVEEGIDFRFNVLSFKSFKYDLFVKSANPQEVVFSILADWGMEQVEDVIEKILLRLNETAHSPLTFQKYVQQLRILAKLRKLDFKIEEIMESIVKYIDEENDILYRRGEQRGEQRGERSAMVKFIQNLLLKNNYTLTEIADLVGTSIDMVIAVQHQLSNDPSKK
jgi:hypothetical protein